MGKSREEKIVDIVRQFTPANQAHFMELVREAKAAEVAETTEEAETAETAEAAEAADEKQ